MAGVTETVRDLIAAYPCGYPNRTEALHQILVVLGSGYEWRNGEAVARAEDGRTCAQMHAQHTYSPEQVALYREYGVPIEEEFITGVCGAEDLRSRADELAVTSGPLRHGPYQPGTGLLFLEVPDDATAEWSLAAGEIAAVVGPLWVAGTDQAKAFDAALTPAQRSYVSGQRQAARERIEALYGRAVQ
ncbi:hypothetical protein [Streptomyces sp. NPDC101455]|uniref:hypothetical protein n=1 Tax=Streptomyces sp. NPDC101455 TaxID=3366142 RepID=UPI0037FE77FD